MKAKLLSAAATALVLALALAALPLTLPKLLGFQIYHVLTQSMTPALPVGSAIYVKPCDASALQAGDIITFTLSSNTSLVETHRVVTNNPEARQLTTKGDANAQVDIDPVSYDRVAGKVLLCIPALGAVGAALHTGRGIAVCAAIFALALLLWALADNLRKRESFQ